jgi:hypothetical protein
LRRACRDLKRLIGESDAKDIFFVLLDFAGVVIHGIHPCGTDICVLGSCLCELSVVGSRLPTPPCSFRAGFGLAEWQMVISQGHRFVALRLAA